MKSFIDGNCLSEDSKDSKDFKALTYFPLDLQLLLFIFEKLFLIENK